MAGYIQGIPYIVLWFASIFAGYAGIFCPLLPVIFISSRLYRKITDFLLTFWQMYPAALLEFIYGCRIHVTGDPISADENTLLVMNHRTRTDWNFLWPAVYQATYGRNRWTYPTKFVLKDSIRHIPGVGWMMQLGSYVYIRRHWEEDKQRMTKALDFFCAMRSKFSLLIFPEGTDLTEQTIKNSNRHADKMNLPHYEHVLHPRTTGFCFLARTMLEQCNLRAIYDVTIIYVDRVPQNELCLVSGRVPKDIRVHFKRYDELELPTTDDGLAEFLERRWAEKEAAIASALANHSTESTPRHAAIELRNDRRDLYIALIFWTLLPLPVGYLLTASIYFRYLVVAHTIFLLALNAFGSGFQAFEIGVHDTRMRLQRWYYSRLN